MLQLVLREVRLLRDSHQYSPWSPGWMSGMRRPSQAPRPDASVALLGPAPQWPQDRVREGGADELEQLKDTLRPRYATSVPLGRGNVGTMDTDNLSSAP